MVKITGIKPREYQETIAETAKKKSCLVVLPTGLGKTAISLIVAVERLNKFPASQIILTAPTRPLAAQHYETFKKHISGTDLDEEFFALITGKISPKKRELIWNTSTIIFSTPQCVANDLRNKRLHLKNFSFLVEDESHRCVRNYDYTHIVKAYRDQSENPLVMGLTASPGSDATTINQICINLGVEAVEIRTRESEDVKPYIKRLKTEQVKVEFPEKFQAVRELFNKILEKKAGELRNRGLLYGRMATKKIFLQMQARLMRASRAGNKHFNILKGISILAEILKLQHAMELLETQSIYSLQKYIKNLEEEERTGKSKAVKNLFKSVDFQLALIKIENMEKRKEEHPKIKILLDIIKKEIKRPNKKIIVFVQYRNTVDKINEELRKAKIKSEIFIGQRGEKGLTQKEQINILKEFDKGKINVLVSTSIGEEGLDISEIDAVIFYEPVPSAIRTIQRRGRTARLKPGKLIILITKKTRDESYHWASRSKEKRMCKALDSIKEKFKKKAQKKQLSLEEFR